MAITISSTAVTLNDGSTFATAASGFGAIGSLAAAWIAGTTVGAGGTIAGTSLRITSSFITTYQGGITISRVPGMTVTWDPSTYAGQAPDQVSHGYYTAFSGSWRAMEHGGNDLGNQGFTGYNPTENTHVQYGHEYLFCRVS